MSGPSEPRDTETFDMFAPARPGPGYDPKVDRERLTGLLRRVLVYMRDHDWCTIAEVAEACGGSETGTAASMRRLRRPDCGGHTVERRRHPHRGGGGLWQYRLRRAP